MRWRAKRSPPSCISTGRRCPSACFTPVTLSRWPGAGYSLHGRPLRPPSCNGGRVRRPPPRAHRLAGAALARASRRRLFRDGPAGVIPCTGGRFCSPGGASGPDPPLRPTSAAVCQGRPLRLSSRAASVPAPARQPDRRRRSRRCGRLAAKLGGQFVERPTIRRAAAAAPGDEPCHVGAAIRLDLCLGRAWGQNPVHFGQCGAGPARLSGIRNRQGANWGPLQS